MVTAAKITDKTRIPELLRQLEYLAAHQIAIGVFGDDGSHLLMIANVHEFGVTITVTPAMRAYLAATGLPLKPTTEVINIPERSYIRETIDTENDAISDMVIFQVEAVITGQQSGQQAMERIGAYVAGLIQRHITDLTTPALHPYTIMRKGSSQPLVDTGRLRQSITWRVEAV